MDELDLDSWALIFSRCDVYPFAFMSNSEREVTDCQRKNIEMEHKILMKEDQSATMPFVFIVRKQ